MVYRKTNKMASWKCSALLLAIVIVVLFEASVNASKLGEQEKKILNKLLENYDSDVVPRSINSTSNGESPVIVTVNMYVRSITNIDEMNMEFGSQITFRQQWNDPRLKFDNMNGKIPYLTLHNADRIWNPDTFFQNEKQGHIHTILRPNILVRIYPNGSVLYSIRISLTLACPMDHKYYPHAKQTCTVMLASYGHNTEHVQYVWKETEPVQITKNLNIPRFHISSYGTSYCTSRTNTGEYSCLKMNMLFSPGTAEFHLKVYLPSAGLIILSWLSFWLHPKAIIARATLVSIVTLLLVLVLTSFKSPPVDYMVSINQWTIVCYIFMIGALIESVLVSSAQIAQSNSKDNENGLINENTQDRWYSRLLARLPEDTNKLDILSRVVFPVTFLLFLIAYYLSLLS